MAKWGVENGGCTGRGFSEVDADGLMAKFEAWVVKTAANHGPEWHIVEDQTSLTPLTCASATDVNTSTEEITIVAHGLSHMRAVRYTAGTAAIAGLTTNTVYYVIRVSANVFKLASTEANAYAGTAINLTSTGTGTQTFTPENPFIVCCDIAAPVLNDYNTGKSGGAPKFIKAGYITTEAGFVRVWPLMWWDSTIKRGEGLCGGALIPTYDSASFSYSFLGGDEGFAVFVRLGTSWGYCILDEFESIGTTFLEGTDKVGVLQSGITAGSSVVLQLAAGQAANFTVGKRYFLYDFNAHTWVNYCTILARDTGTHTVTISLATQNFPAGSVLCAYAHRYAFLCSYDANGGYNNINYYSGYWYMPYMSAIDSASGVVHSQTGVIYGRCINLDFDAAMGVYNRGTLASEDGDWLCSKYLLGELTMHNSTSQTGMNRIYGKTKNVLRTYRASMAQMLDTRTFNSIDYINYYSSSASVVDMIRWEESTV